MQPDLYDDLAERIVHGAQERFVAELTERLVEMFRAGVAEPDRYAVALAADPVASERMHRAARACYDAHFTEERFNEALDSAVSKFIEPAVHGGEGARA